MKCINGEVLFRLYLLQRFHEKTCLFKLIISILWNKGTIQWLCNSCNSVYNKMLTWTGNTGRGTGNGCFASSVRHYYFVFSTLFTKIVHIVMIDPRIPLFICTQVRIMTSLKLLICWSIWTTSVTCSIWFRISVFNSSTVRIAFLCYVTFALRLSPQIKPRPDIKTRLN